MQVITNNHWRNLTYGYELSESERADFDYIDADDFNGHDFLRYRGQVLDMGEFTVVTGIDALVGKWDGIRTDSFFSGVVVKYSDDMDQVKVGLCLA